MAGVLGSFLTSLRRSTERGRDDAFYDDPVAGEPSASSKRTRFVAALGAIVADSGLGCDEQSALLRAMADRLDQGRGPERCRIVPFVPGRRPDDEIAHPGFGTSDVAMVRLADDRRNTATVLFEVDDLPADAEVRADLVLEPLASGGHESSLPSWSDRVITHDGRPGRRRVVIDVDEALDGVDLGVATGLLRRARLDLRVDIDGQTVAADTAHLDVCDIGALGSLYQRIIDRVVARDVDRQAAAMGEEGLEVAFHPWFPVLHIGSDKAALYTLAIVDDIVDKEKHLPDPAWLLRVGIHLELLTCLGIADAVHDDIGDPLEHHERAAFDDDAAFAEVRARVDAAAWRDVWALRHIAFPKFGVPRTGPVSGSNLLAKRRATLAFLHAHHEDLKHAIELAGPNRANAQETWQRVFRDAERAVLRRTSSAFPELAYLPPPMRELVLWQRQGFADLQGLYATACVQYRSSMNHVADWAKARNLMDHTGPECVPASASLLEAHMVQSPRLADLQRGDGYGPSLELVPLETVHPPSTEEIETLVASVPMFSLLSPDDIATLVESARPVPLAPATRLVRHGDEGTSLFIVADGDVEVLVRTEDGTDVLVEPMGRGAIVGEMSLLTGQPRAATVRAGDEGALVFEIAREPFVALARTHPEWHDDLAEMMSDRLARRGGLMAANSSPVRVRERILGFFR